MLAARLMLPYLFWTCLATSAFASQFDDPDPVRIDHAIDALSSTSWHERRQAVQVLVRIGPPAEQRLQKLIESPAGPETRLRAQAALNQILPQRRIEPALITRDFVDANVADTFDRVAEIEGASLRCEPPDLIRNIKHPITARYQNEPYWNVMLDLCRKSGLRLRSDERGVTIIKAGPKAKFDRFCVSGVLLITIPQVISAKDQHIAVFAEPRARMLHGQSVMLSGADLTAGEHVTNGYWWPLRRSAAGYLRSSVRVLLAESEPTLEVPGASVHTGVGGPFPLHLSAGGVSASIMRVVQTQGDYQIDIQLSIDPDDVNWDALIFSMRNGGLRFFDVDDRELTLIRFTSGNAPVSNAQLILSPQGVSLTRPIGRPYRMAWDVPAKTVSKTFPFEFSDIAVR